MASVAGKKKKAAAIKKNESASGKTKNKMPVVFKTEVKDDDQAAEE